MSILKKKMSNMIFFPKVYGKVNFFVSSHGKFTCIYNTYEPLTYAHPWHYKEHNFFKILVQSTTSFEKIWLFSNLYWPKTSDLELI